MSKSSTVLLGFLVLLHVFESPALSAAPARYSQFHPPGSGPAWRGDQRCGPTTLAMGLPLIAQQRLLSKFPAARSVAERIHQLDKLDGKINQGTKWTDMAATARAAGVLEGVQHGVDIASMQRTLEHGGRVFVHGDTKMLPGYAGKGAGHYILLVAHERDGRFSVNDPAMTSLTSIDAPTLRSFMQAYEFGPWMMSIRGD